MLDILFLAALLFKASLSQITGYGNLTADYGGDMHYRCTLANPKGVLQVTWQRLFKDESIENLATYSKRFGEQVNDPYQGKVIFTEASLNSTSITLMNVTWKDESCYICSFNAYPDGSKRRQFCLTVKGISEVETDVHPPRSDQEDDIVVVFSCSATGKPAPNIKWDLPSDVSTTDKHRTITVANGDHTFTTSSNISVQVPPNWSGHVDCLLNDGMTGQKRKRIPFSAGPAPDNKEVEGKSLSSSGVALVVCMVLFSVFIIVAVALKRRSRSKNSRREETV